MLYKKEIVIQWFKEHGLNAEAEYTFAKDIGRRWRFDFVFHKDVGGVAIEVQGGLFIPGGGRHNRGAALMKEHEKLNEAAARKYLILYTIPQNLCTQDLVDLVRRTLHS